MESGSLISRPVREKRTMYGPASGSEEPVDRLWISPSGRRGCQFLGRERGNSGAGGREWVRQDPDLSIGPAHPAENGTTASGIGDVRGRRGADRSAELVAPQDQRHSREPYFDDLSGADAILVAIAPYRQSGVRGLDPAPQHVSGRGQAGCTCHIRTRRVRGPGTRVPGPIRSRCRAGCGSAP